jgi:hypothetical protein
MKDFRLAAQNVSVRPSGFAFELQTGPRAKKKIIMK